MAAYRAGDHEGRPYGSSVNGSYARGQLLHGGTFYRRRAATTSTCFV